MVSEKQIKKFVEDQKVLKLIDRMYTLQAINENQFDTVYSFVEEKGNSTTYERHYYVPDGEFKVEKKTTNTKVISYLGITVFKELDYQEMFFYNPTNGERKYIRKYNDGKLLRN